MSAAETTIEDAKRRTSALSVDQVNKLQALLMRKVEVNGTGGFPTLTFKLIDFIRNLRDCFRAKSIPFTCIKLNGGAASYVLALDHNYSFNDFDVIVNVDLSKDDSWHQIKATVFACLLMYYPQTSGKYTSQPLLSDVYCNKMIKVINDNDLWALISLSNIAGHNIELKFVDRMRRQFQFSVDSFQIHLDSIIDCLSDEKSEPPSDLEVIVESVYGDFTQALNHLNSRLIATVNPEEIRGGGLLKYCDLLARGYRPVDAEYMHTLEKYMCTRFFIDFNELPQQELKLVSYLRAHFTNGEESPMYWFLICLRNIVNKSTICLMNHERRLTLLLITHMADQMNMQYHLKHHMQSRYRYANSSTYRGRIPQARSIEVIYHK